MRQNSISSEIVQGHKTSAPSLWGYDALPLAKYRQNSRPLRTREEGMYHIGETSAIATSSAKTCLVE